MRESESLPTGLVSLIERELAADERLVWLGQPKEYVHPLLGSPRRKCYVLTNKRAIVFYWRKRLFKRLSVDRAQNYESDELRRMKCSEHGGGAGDLIFRVVNTPKGTGLHGFLGIDHVREVEQLVRKTLLSGGANDDSEFSAV